MTAPLFEGPAPRVFWIAPGADFARALADGLRRRLAGRPPEAMARVELTVPTRRGRRAVEAALEAAAQGGPCFLPRVRPIALIGEDAADATDLPPAVDPLRRRLTLARLSAAWLKAAEGRAAPEAAAPALADGLAALIDALDREGLSLDALDAAAPEHALHWERALEFLRILRVHWPAIREESEGGALDPEDRRRRAVTALIAGWAADPPRRPVIAAGSTGSVATTALLLGAVARLPDGALVLPAFDPAQARAVWDDIGPEHPWGGMKRLLDGLGLPPEDARPWVEPEADGAPRRRLIAEALRPAPATDGWMEAREGLAREAAAATAGLALLEAPDARREAAAIAAAMRAELADGRRVALVTPDRTLARRVAAALRRWGIEPDDSGGRPLGLTPPGVFLRLTADLAFGAFDPAALLGLLKHPLMAAGAGRGAHLAAARAFEAGVLRRVPGLPDLAAARVALAAALTREGADDAALLDDGDEDAEPAPAGEGAGPIDAVLARLAALAGAGPTLADLAAAHLDATESLAGPALWEARAGEAARAAAEAFRAAAPAYGPCAPEAYPALLTAALAAAGEVRDEAFRPDPRAMIWGPLEARMQGADLLILGGLIEGVWPAAPEPDAWLSREMRARVGLPPLEARLGLAAHDVLQAACAPRALLTRAFRAGDAPAAPSRWLARLTTLLGGVAPAALAGMRARGRAWIEAATAREAADAEAAAAPRADRPAPRPPAADRPAELWATEIQTLVRDPYAVYARRVLRLRPLDPVGRDLDARDRGMALHEALAGFARATADWDAATPLSVWVAALEAAAEAAFAARGAPAALRRLWRARLSRLTPAFLDEEIARRRLGRPLAEIGGARAMAPPPFRLRARADRVDLRAGGALAIYDYKTGAAPSAKQIAAFDKQMPLEAAIALDGGWDGPAQGARRVETLAHIVLGGKAAGRAQPLEGEPEALGAEAWAGLARLIAAFADPATPYLSRARPQRLRDDGPYDHLARVGEWTPEEAP